MASGGLGGEIWKSWERTGKSEFIKTCKSLCSSSSVDFKKGETDRLSKIFYELCWAILHSLVKQESAVMAIGELSNNFTEIPLVLTDILFVIDGETSTDSNSAYRDKFISLVTGFVGCIPDAVLKERLEQETLECVGLIPSKNQFQAKYVKTKTRLYYRQNKFNLLREESEGYAKLLTELNQEKTEKLSTDQTLENIKSLIGCFDLEPNKVMDVMLESFERQPDEESFYIPLIKGYVSERKTLCHVLGFKFHFYESSQSDDTPKSLYKVAALLLKHHLIDLEDLYQHLSPTVKEIEDHQKKEMADANAYLRKLLVVSLGDKSNEDKDKDEVEVHSYGHNQKLGLCEALLNSGTWTCAKAILDRLPEYYAVSFKPISLSLCALLHIVLDPVYRRNTGLPSIILKRKKLSSRSKADITRATTFAELNSLVFPMVLYLGPHIANDPVLIAKFIRLGKTFMSKRKDGHVKEDDKVAYFGFLNIIDGVLLPALSLLTGNCCMSEELWCLLRLFPYELRYQMYGRWKNETYIQHPILIRAKTECLERAKYIMKRLSKENVKPSGRQLGKLSHSNPGVLFEYVLSQIQRYDNFIIPVVDSLKYLTDISYDVLAYCIIEAVANPEKERLKHDDTNISLWLQSLACFAGCICKKYQVELTGLMQYIANQLKQGKSFDLLLLREVVQKMTGIEISEEITDDQLDAMSGGELLRQEGGYFAQVRNTKKSSTRLKDSLIENDLALSLCLLMSQQRDGVIYHEGAAEHLKLIGKLYDQCQDTLVQFGSFLSMSLSTEEFVKRLPSIDVLVSEYTVPSDAAFFLSRALYAYEISTKYEEFRKIDKSNKQVSSQQKISRYIEASEIVMSPVVELVKPLLPDKVWGELSPRFYVTFWSLSIYDLNTPSDIYNKQIQQCQHQINLIEDNKDMPQSKKKKEKERHSSLMDKMKDEEKRQNEHVQRVMGRLKQEKDSWFLSSATKNETITQFLQLCIFPRCCFTASDAVYCGRFMHILHELKTPGFSTLICYDRIFCDITYTVTSCTENEAHRYGRFLCAAMRTIMKWHSDKVIYERECANYPGFVTVFRKGADSNSQADQLDYENYRHVCHKWHFRLTKAMVSCLESKNYTQIRNALIILTKLLPFYPRVSQFGLALERRVDKLKLDEKDKRPDLYALAMGYSGQLKSKKTLWTPENEFHIKEKDPKNSHKVNGPSSAASDRQNSSRESRHIEVDNKIKEKRDAGDMNAKTFIKKEKNSEKRDGKASAENKKTDPEKREGKSSSSEKSAKDKMRSDKSVKDKIIKEEKKSKEEKTKERKNKDIKSEEKFSKEVKTIKLEKMSKEEKVSKGESSGKERSREDKHRKEMLKSENKETHRDDRHNKDRDKEKGHKRSFSNDREEERSSSVASSGSHGSHHLSFETSPRPLEEKESKRRKLEPISSSSKEVPHVKGEFKEVHIKCITSDRDREYERERKEKKRSMSTGEADILKKRRSEEAGRSASKTHQNGEAESSKKHSRLLEYEDDEDMDKNANKVFKSEVPSRKLKIKDKTKKSDKDKSDSKKSKK